MSPGFCLKVFTELFSLYDLFSSDALRLSDLRLACLLLIFYPPVFLQLSPAFSLPVLSLLAPV